MPHHNLISTGNHITHNTSRLYGPASNMSAPTGFVPKKVMPFDGKLFEVIGADETLSIAHHEMTLLPSPAFPADASSTIRHAVWAQSRRAS